MRVYDIATDTNARGAYYAIIYLPDVGDDLPPAALGILVRAVQANDGRKLVAALALSNLGERARPVRRDMERLLDDSEVGWIFDTALQRIPANPR